MEIDLSEQVHLVQYGTLRNRVELGKSNLGKNISSIWKLKNQPELGHDVTFGQNTEKFKFWNRDHEFLSLLTECDVIVKFGLIFKLHILLTWPNPTLFRNDYSSWRQLYWTSSDLYLFRWICLRIIYLGCTE